MEGILWSVERGYSKIGNKYTFSFYFIFSSYLSKSFSNEEEEDDSISCYAIKLVYDFYGVSPEINIKGISFYLFVWGLEIFTDSF